MRFAVLILLLGALLPACMGPARLESGVFVPGPDPSRDDGRIVASFAAASPALERFFGREVAVRAELVLPEGYRPDQPLPIVYHLPDVGEDPRDVRDAFARHPGLPPIVVVVLDPRGAFGHHLFRDSVNEGPRGESLVTDLIPALERSLFDAAVPPQRTISGNGLGAWSAVRLQLAYPHAFEACWAVVPDPLDFSAFYGADLGVARSLYVGADGRSTRVPAGRFSSLAQGEIAARLASFEAVLAPRADDGRPMPLFDRQTGAVDPLVVESFRRAEPAMLLRGASADALSRLGDLHLIIDVADPLGRAESARRFAAKLEWIGVRVDVRAANEPSAAELLPSLWGLPPSAPGP